MIYEKIKEICDKKGISISKLEQDAGLSNAAIQKWKTVRPRIDKLKSVADVLQVTVDELIE